MGAGLEVNFSKEINLNDFFFTIKIHLLNNVLYNSNEKLLLIIFINKWKI